MQSRVHDDFRSLSRTLARRLRLGVWVFGLYGVWVGLVHVPGAWADGGRIASLAWSVGLFAMAGGAAMGVFSLVAIGAAQVPSRAHAAKVAGGVDSLLTTLLFGWLVLNEFIYWTTFEVLGPETFALIWHNPVEVFENAWEMGARYLVIVVLVVASLALLITRRNLAGYRLFFNVSADDRDAARPVASRAWVGSLTCVAVVFTWQFATRPSPALTTVLRSAPPLRVFNVARSVLGHGLTGSAPATFGGPIISHDEYQDSLGDLPESPPNVVLIVLESVPAGALHCYGYGRADITPNIDALANDGVRFAHCQSAASFSSYGMVSITTSLYLLRAERYDYFEDTSFPHLSLPHALKLAGYELNLFSSGNETFDNIDRFNPPELFDTYFSHDPHDYTKPDSMRMDDRYAGEEFEQWIVGRDDKRPFYCGFYLQSTHFNYEVPSPWSDHYQPVMPNYSNGSAIIRIPDDVLPKLRNQFDNAMRYADHWVGRIRAALEAAGEWDNTLVVITGDHGEGFMEHGLARHGVHTWEEMIHVPLIVYAGPEARGSRFDVPRVVSDTVSTIDIAPTVAGCIGLRSHPSWQGRDVLADDYSSKDRPVFSILQLTRWQETITFNGYKYIYDLTDVQPMLFDLSVDPGETRDLIHEQPELADVMKQMLGEWHARQLAYYAQRPFTHYIGRYVPDSSLIRAFHDALRGEAVPFVEK